MKRLLPCCLLSLCVFLLPPTGQAQQRPSVLIESLDADYQFEYDPATGIVSATNGVAITFEDARLTAKRAELDQQSGGVTAEGDVRLQQGDRVWTGDRLRYNFNTGAIDTDRFRAGMAPFYATGSGVTTDSTNKTYSTTRAFVTTDDVKDPAYRVRASTLKIAPGRYLEARNAVLYLGKVPVFYYPYYRKRLDGRPNMFSLVPGYRSLYGPYLLGAYNWSSRTNVSGAVHLDYRERRGIGTGLDFDYDLGWLGQGSFAGYYLHDQDPQAKAPTNVVVRPDRHRIRFSHHLTLRTNLTATVIANRQTDPVIARDFFESEYRNDLQPKSFLEVSQLWPNFSLSLLAQPRLNGFFETVERLPDVKLSAIRQQLGISPFYYEGESSLGYYRHHFPTGVSNDFSAWRGDSFHQLLLPRTLFGWLNVTPRVGGRFTHYGEADGHGATTRDENRWVLHTGVEVSAKASRLWPGAGSKWFDVDGLRHIVEPSVNYAYVPAPDVRPLELPQFDRELPSLRLLPITFPDYQTIDQIDSQNVLRLSLRNKFQTKRREGVENLVHWALYTDWRLRPRAGQSTFADIYSDMDLKPRSWLTLNSELRYDASHGRFRLAYHTATLQPNNVWSLSLGHRYLRDDPLFGLGNNLITTSLYYRLNENWGARVSHYFEARDGTMEEQYYTIYRDLRSWTGALTFRVRDDREGSTDFTVALTLSLKAFPRYGLGSDRNRPSLLLGG